eukprot:NODE_218_length_12464_cov_0.653781.p8 type:complete len:263 gc:universal NODE_218_length_12464_cov_0.653781:9638-8850(-)
MIPDANFIIAFAIYGADVLLFLQALCKALIVFPNKGRKFFILIIIGLIAAILHGTMVTITIYLGVPGIFHSIFGSIAWYLMIFCSNYLYAMRIKSLGLNNKYDKLVSWTPWIMLIIMIPNNTIGTTSLYIDGDVGSSLKYVSYIIAITFSVLIAVLEIFLYSILFQKLMEILEYRNDAKKKLIYELSASLILLITIDLLLIISKAAANNIDKSLRPFSYLLRLYMLIRFYDELLEEVNKSYLSRLPSRFDSAQDEKSLEFLD